MSDTTDLIRVKADSIIKINGIPFKLTEDIVVEGHESNLQLLSKEMQRRVSITIREK